MERASPYEQPSTAIEEAEAPIRFIDPRGVTRFLQVFLALRAGSTAFGVIFPLILLHWPISYSSPSYDSLFRQFSVFVWATTVVLAFAFTAWLWVSQRNQLALGRGAAHHWIPLLLAGLGVLSLHSFYILDLLRPLTLTIAAFTALGTAYIAYFLHNALQADAPRSQGTRWVLSFRLWVIATAGAILVPSILIWRLNHVADTQIDYRHYSRESFSWFALASETCFLAVTTRLADWQRATHAYMQGVAEGETPAPLPAT